MAADPNSDAPSISPWWALLLLPTFLGVGWLVGAMPGPPVPATQVREASSPAPSPGTSAEPGTPIAPDASAEPSAPLAQDASASPNEPAAVELSDWMSFDSAVSESRRTGKPVFVDFSAEWCGPCQRLKQQVFEDSRRWDQVRGAVIPVSIVDRAREDGSNPAAIEDLQRRYNVDAFPTLIVFSPATGRWQRAQGFGGGDRTVEWIMEAANSVR